jgi:hypothetical protein
VWMRHVKFLCALCPQVKELDLIDEALLSPEQMRAVCALL